MSIDCIWLNTNVSSWCLGIISIGWEIVTQQLPPLWQVDKFSLSSTAAFLPERISLYLNSWQQPLVSSMLSTEPGYIRQQTWRDFNKPQPKWAICFFFLNTSETSPNICFFFILAEILQCCESAWASCNAECNTGTTGTEKSFGVFLFGFFVWVVFC